MKKSFVFIIVSLFTVAFLLACADEKGPAQLAIQAAEQAVNTAKTDAVKFVPDKMAALDAALASAKDKMAKEEYKAALAEAQAIPDMAKNVLASAIAKKNELTQKWTDMIQGIPQMVEAVQSKVDALSQLKKLPKNIKADKLAEIKSTIESVKADFAKAQEVFNAGNISEAITAVAAVKEKALKAMEALGIAPPSEAPAEPAIPAAPPAAK